MTTDRDTTRIVRSWLSSDEHESADRVLDTVLDLLDATPQRRSWRPAWRIANVNLYAKLATAAAAVVVVAIVGIAFFPRGGSNGGLQPSVQPTPTPTPSLAPASTPAPSPSAPTAAFPSDGLLALGRHSMVREGLAMSFAVPSSIWTSGSGFFIDHGTENVPDAAAIIFWPGTPDNVYSEPCKKTPLSPAAATSAAGLAAAVSTVPGTTLVSGPTDVTVGGRPAKHVVIRIPDRIPCPPGQFYLWYDGDPAGGGRYAQGFGETLYVWIVDHDGTLVWVDGETYEGAAPERANEIQQIVDSIQFE